MPEISEADLATYQRGLALLKQLEGDPKSKAHFESAIKAVIPDIRTQSDEVREHVATSLEPTNAALAKIQEALDAQAAERKEQAERSVETRLNSAFDSFKDKGVTDAGLEGIKKLMVDRSIADPEAAYALFMQQNPAPPAEAPAWQPDGWDISSTAKEGGMRDMEGLMKNEDGWADKEAAIALNEIRIAKAA